MNQSSLSELFGQQLKVLTTGTEYEIKEGQEENDRTESRVRAVMYNLWMDAQSKKLADKLTHMQEKHFKQLYEFSYGVTALDYEDRLHTETGSLALMIIDEKRAFTKRISRLYERYERFRQLTHDLDYPVRDILIDYFELNKKIDYAVIRTALIDHLIKIELIYKRDEDSKELIVDEIEEDYQATQGKQRYLINKKYIYMTPEEYEDHLQSQQSEFEKIYGELGI